MTKTLSLNTRQWRVLLHDNLDVLKAAVQSTETIDEAGLKQIHAQLDDMKMLAVAWFQVGVPAAPVEQAAQAAQANGAESSARVKRKYTRRSASQQAVQ